MMGHLILRGWFVVACVRVAIEDAERLAAVCYRLSLRRRPPT